MDDYENRRPQKKARLLKVGDEREWYDRAPNDDELNRRLEKIRRNGLLADVVFWVGYPWYGLELIPQEQMPLEKPPFVGTPWHISLGTYNDDSRNYHTVIQEVQQKFAKPKMVRLIFNYLRDNGYAQLDPEADPIASNPLIQRLKALDSYYREIDLHISM